MFSNAAQSMLWKFRVSALILALYSGVILNFVAGAPLSRPTIPSQVGPQSVQYLPDSSYMFWPGYASNSAQCLTHISPDDRAEIERGLLSVRDLDNGLEERDIETYVFNVSFNVIYTNETREGGWVPWVIFPDPEGPKYWHPFLNQRFRHRSTDEDFERRLQQHRHFICSRKDNSHQQYGLVCPCISWIVSDTYWCALYLHSS